MKGLIIDQMFRCFNFFIFAFLVSTSLLTSCKSYQFISQEKLQGVFISRNNSNSKIVLQQNQFIMLVSKRNIHSSICCDTASIAEFIIEKERGLLVINSPEWLNPVFTPVKVIEKEIPLVDSVRFIIKSPIEEAYRQNNNNGALQYVLLAYPYGKSLAYFSENFHTYSYPEFSYHNPAGLSIIRVSLFIMPIIENIQDVEVREIIAEFDVQNKKANYFEIYLPELNYAFISYKRFKGSYAKIIDRNTIIWEGEEYAR